ncbi:haloacid dehalogenase type II [Salinimonas marina]|uniref:(S)-2-haloacid dehalogenase n=1 Tax=Salinimonas marina TaxID=2785918 RepID=A0A7S9DXN1_9ALTE|nr:haloacid dehalogenase type II [Salinimonas marina]QPG05863.1 haloacid dehalogenase type II [Salinimonas marina]
MALASSPKVIFFDVNETLLDMQAVKTAIAEVLDGDESLVPVWFAQLLHHSLVDSATNQYHDFAEIGAAALVMVAHSKGKTLSMEQAKDAITTPMTQLPAHDEVKAALARLQQGGFTLVAFSNSAEAGLNRQLLNAGVRQYFDAVLSVSSIKRYKPHGETYQWAVKTMQADTHESLMVAAHGWDVSGAKAAGLQTAFIERPGKMMYPLGLTPDLSLPSLSELADELGV